MRKRWWTAIVAAALVAAMMGPGVASAHALLLRSDPAEDAVVPTSPPLVHLWFSEDLNAAASKIIVWNRDRHPVTAGNATVVLGQPRQMEVRLKHLVPGSYLVLWTSVSAQDGHILHGYFLFSVKHQGPGPSLVGVSTGGSGQGFPDGVTLASILAHWIELLAAVTWAGVALFSAWVLPDHKLFDGSAVAAEQNRLRSLIGASLLALLTASTVILVLQAYALAGNNWGSTFTGTSLSAAFAAQYGQIWIARQLLVLLALLLWSRLLRWPVMVAGEVLPVEEPEIFPSARPVAQATLGFIYLYAFAASGHAASAEIGVVLGTNLLSLSVLSDWLHVLADAAWLGGQIYLVLILIPALRLRREPFHTGSFLRTLDRFSPVAYACVATYVVSGLFAAKVHIPSWYAFFNSVYGRALIVKVGLIGLMMLISTLTVFLIRPRLRTTIHGERGESTRVSAYLMHRLLRWLQVNPVLGVGVLLATSVMFYYPVPVGFSPAGPVNHVLHVGGLTATVTVTPDRSGPNQMTVVLRDQAGHPVSKATVTVLTTMLDMVMGTGLASLQESRPGTFVGTTDLGMGGRWKLQLLVYRPSGLLRANVDIQVGT